MKKLMLLFAFIAVIGYAQDGKVSHQIMDGQQVTLTAVPDSGWVFTHWSGDLTGSENPKTITMTQDMEVTAHFFRAFTLTIMVDGGGSVTVDPSGIDF